MQERSDHPYYELHESCGHGGMGVVYRARDKRLNRTVALKFIGPAHSRSPDALDRFTREAQAVAALNHPNIATLYEVGEWDGEPFIALEFLPNATLKDRLRHGRLPLQQALQYAAQVGAGLEFGHSRGILHRDVKPANCMFSGLDVLKLVDFGLAKSSSADDVTRTGMAVGTIAYMAPEVLRGEEATSRSDIYSLGAVVYEMLSGSLLHNSVSPIAEMPADVPGSVSQAVARATARRPEERFASAAEFLEHLGCGSILPASTRSDATQTMSPALHPLPVKRRRLAYVLTLVATLIVGAAVGYRWLPSLTPASESTVVVLPFENLGANPANQLLCDGLQETVNSTLSRTGLLKKSVLIVPSSEVRRNRIRTIADARQQFRATLAIAGTVQRTPEEFQLTLSLADAISRRQKDSRIISMPAAETARLQPKLVDELGAMFGAESVLDTEVKIAGEGTANSQAYDLFLQGRGALESRNWDQAERLLSKSLELDPAFALGRAKLAEVYVRKNLSTKDPKWLALADDQVSMAARKSSSPDVLWVQAMIRKQTGDTEKAIQLFKKLLETDPNNIESYRFLAEALDTAGRSQEAEGIYRQAIDLRPGYWPTYLSLGDFYFYKRDYAHAEQTLLKGMGFAGDNALLNSNLGALYFQTSRWDDAAKYFQKSISTKPNALAYSNLGTIQFFQGKFESAAKQFREATRLQGANPVNWGNLGDALWQLPGERTHALEAFQTASQLASQQLALNPTNWRLRKSYGLYLAKLGRNGDAIAETEHALIQAPSDTYVQFYAARVYAVTGDRTHALAALKRCRNLGINPSEIERDPDFQTLKNAPEYAALLTVNH